MVRPDVLLFCYLQVISIISLSDVTKARDAYASKNTIGIYKGDL